MYYLLTSSLHTVYVVSLMYYLLTSSPHTVHVVSLMYYLLTSSPHIVHVVSILEAPKILGSVSFQSNEVSGAQNSEFLL